MALVLASFCSTVTLIFASGDNLSRAVTWQLSVVMSRASENVRFSVTMVITFSVPCKYYYWLITIVKTDYIGHI